MRELQKPGVIPLAEVTAMSGVDFLRGVMEGRYPGAPIAKTLNFWLASVEKGAVAFEGEPTPDYFNPISTIHGGWACTILDSALACAIHSMLKPGQGYTSVDIKVNFVKAVLPGEILRCDAKILHFGGRIATSEGYLRNKDGVLFAHGVQTGMIFGAGSSKAR